MTEETLVSALNPLITDRVVYFPIRHHSPACALHLEWLIREWKPSCILVEGPASFTSLIPLMLHPGTKAPFAIYTSFTEPESAGEPAQAPAPGAAISGPERHAAYYPFCDYSPELAALRAGSRIGSTLRFIDLDYPAQIMSDHTPPAVDSPQRVESLLSERHLKRSQYLQTLARRAGCRDHNDLWDHFFETRLLSTDANNQERVAKFIRDVAAWCYFARADCTPEELESDGTLARESQMAAAIEAELKQETARILVVTGGFHTTVLPQLLSGSPPAARALPRKQKAESFQCLIRYSFEQLDALNGYSAGMPSPYYYDQLWRSLCEEPRPEAFATLAAKILVELGQHTRREKLTVALSPADAIAALEQSCRLAALRGHPGPSREDLLDGIRSCFVKGSMDAEGAIVLGLAQRALGGSSIGTVPLEAGTPPIVEDFRSTAQRLRFDISNSLLRKRALDLYRKKSHRLASRFLHCLTFLGVPFGSLRAGPDFVNGTNLDRLFEHWQYQWTPRGESQLIEAGIHGATIEEACANRLIAAVLAQEKAGKGRDTAASAGILIQACRMGLHAHTGRLLGLLLEQVNQDSSLQSLTPALNQLMLLWESREPLEAHRLTEMPLLIGKAYERACFLLHLLADTPPQDAYATLESLLTLRELLKSRAADLNLDPALFYQPLSVARHQPQCPPLVLGGVTGLLYADGFIPQSDLLQLLAGSLGADASLTQVPFLIGLLRACRELAWREPAIVSAVESLLASWTDDEFVERVPHLRLAFADLTPRETDQVATVVAELHGGAKIGPLYSPDLSEAEIMTAARINLLVGKALHDDGLGAWGEPSNIPVIASSTH